MVSLVVPGRASSHREAPLISGDPQADTTDVYAFVSPDAPDTVTLIASWSRFEDPAGGPNFYKFGDNDLVQVFLTGVPNLNQPSGVRASEMLRLNMDIQPVASPNRLGALANDIAGFPNGRRLSDDVVDITLRVAAGALSGANSTLGDGVDRNDVAFRPTFPYLALPHSGSNP